VPLIRHPEPSDKRHQTPQNDGLMKSVFYHFLWLPSNMIIYNEKSQIIIFLVAKPI